jgi:6-phosphogluconolactonase
VKAEILSAGQSLDASLDRAAEAIFSVLKDQPKDAPLVIGLCGGRSVVGLLGALERCSVSQPPEILRRVQFFMVDERLVPITDENSNFGGLQKLLFDKLVRDGVLARSQLHPFNPQMSLPDAGCAAYGDELQRHGGRFTVVVLGVGEDGHIAGLFPHHPTLQHTDTGFLSFFDSPKPPPARMTAGPTLITSADLSVVLLLGEGKRGAWETFRAGRVPIEECPALLALTAKRCVVITDLGS